MSLSETIKNDLLAARRQREDKVRINLLTALASDVVKVGKDARNGETTDAEAVAVIRKYLGSAEETRQAIVREHERRSNTVDDDERYKQVVAELAILNDYLPRQLGDDELAAAVDRFIGEQGLARNKSSMGAVMGHLKAAYPGQYDGKTASRIVASKLTG